MYKTILIYMSLCSLFGETVRANPPDEPDSDGYLISVDGFKYKPYFEIHKYHSDELVIDTVCHELEQWMFETRWIHEHQKEVGFWIEYTYKVYVGEDLCGLSLQDVVCKYWVSPYRINIHTYIEWWCDEEETRYYTDYGYRMKTEQYIEISQTQDIDKSLSKLCQETEWAIEEMLSRHGH